MTTAQTTVGDKPDWVTYFIQDPQTKQFVHTTYFKVPADTRVNVTILGYDGCTPLRNPVWGKVTGTAGNVEVVKFYNGKTYSAPQAISLFDSWANCSVQHTFAIPGLGLNVPIASLTTFNGEQQPVRHVSLRGHPLTRRCAAHGGHVQLHDAEGGRHLPLAVLRALRAWLRGRQRRADGHARLHDGSDGGAGLMAAEAGPRPGRFEGRAARRPVAARHSG